MYITDASKQYKHKFSPCVLLVESYRDKLGKPRRRTILNLSKTPPAITQAVKLAVAGKTPVSLEEVTQPDNRSLGEVTILHRLAGKLGIINILKQKLGRHITALVLAMVINRVSEPRSRYGLREWLETNYLAEIVEVPLEQFHHNRLYEALKLLTNKQQEIEAELWGKTKQIEGGLRLILYDITSTYLEGQQCELAEYGYSRDKKRGKKQILVALVTTPTGRPVSVEVLRGNTADKSTLMSKVRQLKERFGLEEVIYVFDRGMRDEGKLGMLRSSEIAYITALTRGEVGDLVKEGVIQLGLFDQQMAEYREGNKRYIVCRSAQWQRNRKRREELLRKTEEGLEGLRRSVITGKVKDAVKIAKKAGWKVRRWKLGRYFNLKIQEGYFGYERRNEQLREAEELDWVYVLETTEQELEAQQIQEGYKNLAKVEEDFRELKSVLEVRPVNHRKEETVRGHVFVCFLALYLRKQLELLLQPLFEHQPEVTFSRVLTRLKEIRQSRLQAGEYQRMIVNQLDQLQQEILTTLKMRILPLQLPNL